MLTSFTNYGWWLLLAPPAYLGYYLYSNFGHMLFAKQQQQEPLTEEQLAAQKGVCMCVWERGGSGDGKKEGKRGAGRD